jgi:hypothetical protein
MPETHARRLQHGYTERVAYRLVAYDTIGTTVDGVSLLAYPEWYGVSTAIQSVFGPVVYEHCRDSRLMRGFGFGWYEAPNYFHFVILGGP